MDRLRQKAVEAFHLLPHGGLEIGGLLFGRVYPNARTPLRIEIVAEREIACAHQSGPAFILTDAECSEIQAQLERTRIDPEIAALSVLGFWVSHGRGDVALSPADLNLYRCFPNPWQFALVLKPQIGRPTRAAFMYRSGLEIAPHDPQYDFFADPHLSGAPVPPLTPSAPEPAAAPHEPEFRVPAHPGRDPKTIAVSLAVWLIMLAFFTGAGLTFALMTLGGRAAFAH